MTYGERMYDTQGNEVALFPMEYMYISNTEHHLLGIDFLGWGANGRVYACPCYAPFSGRVVYNGNDHNMIYWSNNPVRCADGTLSDVTVLVAHSDTAPAIVGSVMTQGDLWYHTGNYGWSSGDHLHMEVAKGHVMWDPSGQYLNVPSHLYEVVFVNDVTIVDGAGYNWVTYDGPQPPPVEDGSMKKFPWVVFARKLRDRSVM